MRRKRIVHRKRKMMTMEEIFTFTKKSGFFLLGVWLIAVGVFSLTNIRFSSQELVTGLLGLASGILIAFGKD